MCRADELEGASSHDTRRLLQRPSPSTTMLAASWRTLGPRRRELRRRTSTSTRLPRLTARHRKAWRLQRCVAGVPVDDRDKLNKTLYCLQNAYLISIVTANRAKATFYRAALPALQDVSLAELSPMYGSSLTRSTTASPIPLDTVQRQNSDRLGASLHPRGRALRRAGPVGAQRHCLGHLRQCRGGSERLRGAQQTRWVG